MKIQPVILAGGVGSRLWPLSRGLYPKQLLRLVGEHSLLQQTLLRLDSLPEVLPAVVVVGEEHRFITLAQIDELGERIAADSVRILLEPIGKNTAPAICGAAEFCKKNGEDTVLLALPADHLVADRAAFAKAVAEAIPLAAGGSIVTFGIQPESAETGYGYIERGEGAQIVSFHEKPDLATVEKFLQQGNFYWNAGMFAFTAAALLEEMAQHAPEIAAAMALAVAEGKEDGRFFRFDAAQMACSPEDSIDYAVMEKTARAVVVPAVMGWNDIGSWKALWQVQPKDDRGNVTSGDTLLEGTEDSIVCANSKLVAAVGLKDTLVVETDDAVLVSSMSCAQDVKKIVSRLKRQKRPEYSVHTTVYRPWGSYTVLEIQPRFQIKRITVNPGARLSLQMHHHRSEHWVVVSGTARVTRGETVSLVYENEAAYIPPGTMHRLENPGVIPLELIETQLGSYLGEDDIVRFEDVYGRSE